MSLEHFHDFQKTHTWGPDVQVKEALKWREEHDGHHDDLSLRHVDGAEGEGPRDVGLPVSAVEQGGGTQTLDKRHGVRSQTESQSVPTWKSIHPG